MATHCRTTARRTAVATAAVTMIVALVGGTAAPAAPAAQATSGTGRSVEGVWRTDGYGTVLEIDDDLLRTYQTTAVGCLPGETARRSGSDARSASASASASASGAASGSGAAWVSYTTEYGTVLTVRPGTMRVTGSVGDRRLHRLPALPAECTRPAPSNPVAVFDTFWQTFEENYPFFAAKGIDWHAVRDRYRPRIHVDTSDDELFAVLSDMVRPLHDAHVSIAADDDRYFKADRPGTEDPTSDMDERVKEYVQERDLRGRPLQESANGRIGYADLPGGQGYLRVTGFGGYADGTDETYEADAAELDRALDSVFTRKRTSRLSGMIIDLRVNGGGDDGLGLQLAGRLTDRAHFAYAKRARNHPTDATRFTAAQRQYVRPAQGPRFTGPVAILTGGSTVSAGETFAEALMERPGRTVRIGQRTQGVFSDILSRDLPNGWWFGLPNEQFLTRTGTAFDGVGIPPQLPEPVFTDEEFDRHRDSAFDRAVAVLRAPV
ncbi:S41 family peptidase [Streptomyces sp. NPDC001970]